VSVDIDIDSRKLTEAFRRIPNVAAQNMRIAMRNGLSEVRSEARSNHDYTSRSGKLSRSIKTRVDRLGLAGAVYLNTGVAPYGPYQHEGTKRHYVAPVRAKALHWVEGGKNRFSQGHYVSGIKRNRFVYEAAEAKQRVVIDGISAAIRKTIKEAGL
jgi:hypothetical protein